MYESAVREEKQTGPFAAAEQPQATVSRVMQKVRISCGAAQAEAHHHGAHLTSWTVGGKELIFVSSQAVYKLKRAVHNIQPPKAIRGGIPICFPQFSDFGDCGQHGFARNSEWTLVEAKDAEVLKGFSTGQVTSICICLSGRPVVALQATFSLKGQGVDQWKHAFEASFVVSLDELGALTTKLLVKNPGDKPFTFTVALHTYFSVSAIDSATVVGLQGCKYLDSLEARVEKTDEEPAVKFGGEVDRIYMNTDDELRICDSAENRTVVLKKSNLPDAVVWNPWIEKSQRMGDFGDEVWARPVAVRLPPLRLTDLEPMQQEYKVMLCVEAGAIKSPVTVEPGAEWAGSQTLSLLSNGNV
eukprot:scaffold2799_cov408-Prasinococcus_capsulatus_cf.AAC.14